MPASGGARVGVLLVHGMGNPTASFAVPLVERLVRALAPDDARVAFEACYWADLLQGQQDRTWARLQRKPMRHERARRWIVGTLGDPVSYLAGYLRQGEPAYAAVHARLRARLVDLARRVGGDAPLVVLAHSLGGVVASNYVWDEQRRHGAVHPHARRATPGAPTTGAHPAPGVGAHGPASAGETPMERMETLAALVTYGCSIPLFLPPSPPIECIRFPPPTLAPRLRAVATWLNVYDPDDLLGYPIGDVWDVTHGTTITDVPLEVGGALVGWTPWVHTRYDTDAGFVALVRDVIARVLAALDDGDDGDGIAAPPAHPPLEPFDGR